MDRMTKFYRNSLGTVFVLILMLPLMFNCSTKKVGPNTPPEFEITEPPAQILAVVMGNVDYTQVQGYQNIIQAAVDAGSVTTDIQNAMDTFNSLINANDLNYLVSLDSIALDNIAATGQLPQEVTDIIAKLTSWNFLPIVTESSVSDSSQGATSRVLNAVQNQLAKLTGPFEDCVAVITDDYNATLETAQNARNAGIAAAATQGSNCQAGRSARLDPFRALVTAFCGFAPQNVCDLLNATFNLIFLSDIASCNQLSMSTEQAYIDAFNQIVIELNVWRAAQNEKCHQTFGGN